MGWVGLGWVWFGLVWSGWVWLVLVCGGSLVPSVLFPLVSRFVFNFPFFVLFCVIRSPPPPPLCLFIVSFFLFLKYMRLLFCFYRTAARAQAKIYRYCRFYLPLMWLAFSKLVSSVCIFVCLILSFSAALRLVVCFSSIN